MKGQASLRARAEQFRAMRRETLVITPDLSGRALMVP